MVGQRQPIIANPDIILSWIFTIKKMFALLSSVLLPRSNPAVTSSIRKKMQGIGDKEEAVWEVTYHYNASRHGGLQKMYWCTRCIHGSDTWGFHEFDSWIPPFLLAQLKVAHNKSKHIAAWKCKQKYLTVSMCITWHCQL